MKALMLLISCFSSVILIHSLGCTIDNSYYTIQGYTAPGPDEVHLGPNGVEIPIGRMLLIRYGSVCCALRFTRVWTEKDGKEKFSEYEVYYQGDGSGEFMKNVKFRDGKSSFLRPRGVGRLIWQPGNPEVECGSLKLAWDYKTFVAFFESGQPAGEYGIELAPTPWKDIKEVYVSDPRIKWYKYDDKREMVNIPIDRLWEEKR